MGEANAAVQVVFGGPSITVEYENDSDCNVLVSGGLWMETCKRWAEAKSVADLLQDLIDDEQAQIDSVLKASVH